MNKKLTRWEHEGWVGIPNRDILRCLAAELKVRTASTIFKLAESGSTEKLRCREASELAKRAARTPTAEDWNLTLPQNTSLPGLSLQGNRQRVFYRRIREIKVETMAPRASTEKMLATVRRKYWSHIPECEERATCKDCGVVEDLEHILLGCASPGQELVWKAAESLWREKEPHWPMVSLGTILGCGLAEFKDDRGRLKRGTQRLYRILISESAYLIWKLRNDRVISRDGTLATEDEIINKWKFAINQRLQVDKMLANRPCKGKRPALLPQLVLETWSNTLDNETSLPADWLREPRVLVGKRAFPQTQTRRQNSRGIG
ncbi:hypothetical protein B0H13DRAFT_1890726 [Mycena leptocephala]|nr:hypothetical protein B0H13DRAFT_1890726 [Mycena leptocephala]